MKTKFLKVNWRVFDGAARQKRALRLRPDDDGVYICPIEDCLHTGFKSARGLRKHIDTRHDWYYFFDTRPEVKREEVEQDPSKERQKCFTQNIPSFSITEGLGLDFLKWLQAPLGGGKNPREATQTAKRGMKFLLHVIGEDMVADNQAYADYIDCAVGSATAVIQFLETITTSWSMSSSGALNYLRSISDLVDFRKSQGVSDNVLRALSVTEVYLRRGKSNLQKKKVVEYSRNLDLESLIAKDSWCSLEDMQKVIPFHAPRYKDVHERCKSGSTDVTVSDLAFASRFVATYLFLRVKCSRPRTFQFLTMGMVERSRTNGGYVDQTEFKTASKYIFDTLIIDSEVLQVLDMYTQYIRPRMQPKCEYLVISNTGNQYNSFTTAMTVLVKQAIGKYVHPTRLRQIVESSSQDLLTPEEQQIVSSDQKHSSYVAQRSYLKRLSRDVASKGKECIGKMLGPKGAQASTELASILAASKGAVQAIDERVITQTCSILTNCPSSATSNSASPTNLSLDDSMPLTRTQSSPSMESDELEVTCSISADKHSGALGVDKLRDLPTWPLAAKPILDVKEESEKGRRDVRKKQKFTKEEDRNLVAGVRKFGEGHWNKILAEPGLQFNKCRTRDSLRMRFASNDVQKLMKSGNT